MLLRIEHKIAWELPEPARFSIHYLRLWPTNEPTQAVVDWQVETRGRASPFTDGYGNKLLSVSWTEPTTRFAIRAGGVVETRDSAGVYGFALDPLPLVYWRHNEGLARFDGAVAAFAAGIRAEAGDNALALAHRLMSAIHARKGNARPQAQIQSQGGDAPSLLHSTRRQPEDLAHLFIATARCLGLPARFATGYLYRPDAPISRMHAWAEVHFEKLGWVGFDPVHSVSPTEHYVRVAVGRDAGETMPIAGLREDLPAIEVKVAAIAPG